jgi:HD-GYP domain-containing protein (c-di-GMP phosphodiesterase class II)
MVSSTPCSLKGVFGTGGNGSIDQNHRSSRENPLADQVQRITMKTNSRIQNRWLLVVLVCAVQLVAALGLIKWGMSAFRDKSITMLSEQILDQAFELGDELAVSIDREFANIATPEPDAIIAWVDSNIRSSKSNVFGVIDAESFQLLYLNENGKRQSLAAERSDLRGMVFHELESPESLDLQECLRNPLVRAVRGISRLNESDHLVSVHSVLRGRAFLLVGQPSSKITGRFAGWISTARNVVFTTTLLVGFLAIFLNTSILQKFDNEISAIHRQLTDALLKRTSELTDTQNGVIFGLAKLAESRDNDTGDHLERICGYVKLLVEEVRDEFSEIDDDFVENISFASSLHDIGKVGIPDAVLLKPGRLTDMERKIMEFHTVIGGECLQAIQRRLGHDEFLRMAHDIAVAHHERWDGTGYPHKLSGEQTPLAARILAVADVYDALTSKRPYKAPMSHEKSSQLIREGSGTQFDPRVVAAFSRRAEDFRRLMEQGRQVDDDSVVPAIARLQQVLSEAPELAVSQV